MTIEWVDLKTGKEVFDRAAEGWEVEVDNGSPTYETWGGNTWCAACDYRGRPRQPKTRTVKILCWLCFGDLVWREEDQTIPNSWERVPSEDKTAIVEARK